MRKYLWSLTVICFLSLCLVACSATQQATTVAASGTALAAADTLAMQYVTLPLCPGSAAVSPSGTLCSQAIISAKIKNAAAQAYTAYKAYEANPSDALNTAAVQAVTELLALIPTPKPTN